MTKMPTPDVQATIAKAVQAEHDQKVRKVATGFLDRFLRLFSDYSFSTARSHKRAPVAASLRTPGQVAAEVHAFFAARPRPWRPASHRARPEHKVHFSYKRARKAA